MKYLQRKLYDYAKNDIKNLKSKKNSIILVAIYKKLETLGKKWIPIKMPI